MPPAHLRAPGTLASSPSPTQLRRDRRQMEKRIELSQCSGKVAYSSPGLAQKKLSELTFHRNKRQGVYRCPHCSRWHIGRS